MMATLEELDAIEEAKPECPRCEGTGNSHWARVLYALWYDFQHVEAIRLLRTAPDLVPRALVDLACEVLARGESWHYYLDQGDVDALADEDRLWRWTRRPITGKEPRHRNGTLLENTGYRPTAEEVNATDRRELIHDTINMWVVCKYRLARWDMGDTCGACRGTGKVGGLTLAELDELAGVGRD